MNKDCKDALTGGKITLSKSYKISVITSFIDGWKQQICIVCENEKSKVQNIITLSQRPCKETENCPGACDGFLDKVKSK